MTGILMYESQKLITEYNFHTFIPAFSLYSGTLGQRWKMKHQAYNESLWCVWLFICGCIFDEHNSLVTHQEKAEICFYLWFDDILQFKVDRDITPFYGRGLWYE